MRYVSTRGGVEPVGFTGAMLAGLAADGGLFVPEEVPVVPEDVADSWRNLNYAELAAEVLARFATDIDRVQLAAACRDAYSETVFSHDDIVPVLELVDGARLLRLSYGPTLAFKDMAMQLLGRLFDLALAERGERLVVVGATSGDTGSAAEYAMVGRSNIAVVMLSPWGRVSRFQAAQMYSLDEPNIVNVAIDGPFDVAQDLVKAVNADAEFKARHSIGAVNSINWARVAAQVVYYVWAYLRAVEPIEVAVPTGNFGNIYAGLVARRMGFPLRFILATNENDVLDEFFRTGIYRPRLADAVAATSSPSMDIAKASNLERFVHDLVGDGDRVAELWRALQRDGEFDLSAAEGFRRAGDYVVTGVSSHSDRLNAIRSVAVGDGVLIDPHTADGVAVGRRLATGDRPLVCLETAQAVKFEDTIVEALGQRPPPPPHLADLESRPHHVERIRADLGAVRRVIEKLGFADADL